MVRPIRTLESLMLNDDVAALMGFSLCSLMFIASVNWFRSTPALRLHTGWLVALSGLAALQALEFLYHTSELYMRFPFFIKLPDPFVVLIPFTIYGFIRSIQGDIRPIQPKPLLVHISPALMVFALDIPFWMLPSEERVHWMGSAISDEFLWEPLAPFGNNYLAIIGVLSLGYWLLQKTQGLLTNRTTVVHWVKRFQLLQAFVFITLFGRIVLSAQEGIYLSMAYALAPVSAYLLYLLLSQSQLPPVPMKPRKRYEAKSSMDLNTEQHTVEPEDINTDLSLYFAELEQLMQSGLFKQNALSLSQLADAAGLSTHQASAAINQCSGNNFYDWLNGYRIQAATELLLTSDISISRICYEVGYNSKSTFNAAFKKQHLCTPTEFRKRNTH